MFVGTCWIDIQIPGIRSLKEKRSIVKSVKERIRANYNVSVAEVGSLDSWQRTEIGLACVGNEKSRIDHVLSMILDKIKSDPRINVIDIETEIS
jgi:uncharacterized protein